MSKEILDSEIDGKQVIAVVGDPVIDKFVNIPHGSEKITIKMPGGTFFVSKTLENGLNKVGTQVLGYKKEAFSLSETLKIPIVSWEIKTEEPVMRCKNIMSSESLLNDKFYQKLAHEAEVIDQKIDMLVVHDLNLEMQDQNSNKDRYEHKWGWSFEKLKVDPSSECPSLFFMLNRGLPDFEEDFWEKIFSENDINARTLAIVYADTLRKEGVTISKRISWERTAQDYLKELYTHPVMKNLRRFNHLIVRFGFCGAIHSYRIGKIRYHRLFFDPMADHSGIYCDPVFEGDVIGNQSVFITSIVKDLISNANTIKDNGHKVAERVGSAIKKSIVRCQLYYEKGLSLVIKNDEGGFNDIGGFNENLFKKDLNVDRIADERIPIGNSSWSIINQSAEYNLLEVAVNIVQKGVENVLNKQLNKNKRPVWAPVVKFGKKGEEKLKIIDRREIESYRAAHRLLKKAFESQDKRKRPLCIAVFGPPGAGKSFVVKELLKSANLDGSDVIPRTINISQLTEPEQFIAELKKNPDKEELTAVNAKLEESRRLSGEVGDRSGSENDTVRDSINININTYQEEKRKLEQTIEKQNAKNLPICFLVDEFDCDLNTEPLGWLKYFLSRMENWKGENPPILIFAGGTSKNYHDFSREDSSVEKKEQARFAMAKGPDFVSRLVGHIDILGPDPVDDNDDTYVIRRAVFLRSLILDNIFPNNGERDENIDLSKEKKVNGDIVRAMLNVTEYKHGMRSMRAILDMSVKLGGDGGIYVSGSLPSLVQLNMHVDGNEFMNRLHEARLAK